MRRNAFSREWISSERRNLACTPAPDPEVLRLCAEENRILVTHDRYSMPDHFIEFIQRQDSPGVFIISRKLPIGKATEWLLLYWAASEAEEHQNQIIDIP